MDCDRIQDRLVDYLTEETRITERLCVDVHLATCYHCREAMEDVRTVLDGAQEAIRYAGPERSFEASMNEIRTREALIGADRNTTQQPSRRWSWGIAASALPVVVACVTPFIVAWPGTSPAVTIEDTPESIIESILEPNPYPHDLAAPIDTGQFDLLNSLP